MSATSLYTFFHLPAGNTVKQSVGRDDESSQADSTAYKPAQLQLVMRIQSRADIEHALQNAIQANDLSLIKNILKNLPDSVKKDPVFHETLRRIGEKAGNKEISALIASKVKELSPVPSASYRNSARFGFASSSLEKSNTMQPTLFPTPTPRPRFG